MGWFADWKTKRIHVTWEYSAKGNLWRVVPSEDGLFVLEDRNVESKSVSFACTDCGTGKILWDGLSLVERWWVSIEAVHRNMVLFHEYASPDMPDHKKIIGVDVHSGEVRWMNEELKFLFAHGDCIYAAKDEYEQRRFFEIDLESGTIRREIDTDLVGMLRETAADKSATDSIDFPLPFSEAVCEDEVVKDAVKRALQKSHHAGLIEYLDRKSHVVVGYYENTSANTTQPMFHQQLVVIEKERNTIAFSDSVESNVSVNVPDTFFGMEECVYYIKNKKTLRALNLGGEGNVHDKN